MSIETPMNWWKPFSKDEKWWMIIIVVWAAVMFVMMPLGHFWGHNITQETYRTTPEEFLKVSNAFIAKYGVKGSDGKIITEKVGTNTIKVVDPSTAPKNKDGSIDVFLRAEEWQFVPILIFKKNQRYRIHMSSAGGPYGLQHGFSLQPQNLNYQILPDYDMVVTITPTSTGDFPIICNEYCGPPHHTMNGRIKVVE